MTGNSLRGILNIKSMLLNMNIQKLKWIRSTLMEIRGTGISSVKVNDQYRIEFIEDTEDGKQIATICNITELSNHYKKK